MKKYFSQRTDWDLRPNDLRVIMHKKELCAKTWIDLTNSNPTLCDIEYPVAEMTKHLTKTENFIYKPDPKGQFIARQAVSTYYQDMNIDVNPENIFITASTSEAYSYLFRLLTNPGDEVLVPAPSYPLFQYLADLDNLRIKSYPLEYTTEGWLIPCEALIKLINKHSRAIIFVHPNNPTGSFVDRSCVEDLIQSIRTHSLSLICDEVFYDYRFAKGSVSVESFAALNEVPTFTLNGLSKMLGLPQLKLAWLMVNGPDSFVEEAIERLELISDTYLSVNSPVQLALPEMLSLRHGIQVQVRGLLERNHKHLEEIIKKYPMCECLRVDGGWSVILRFPALMDDELWALKIFEEEDVLIHPGCFFHFPKDGYFVLSLLVKHELFRTGIERVLRYVEKCC